MDDRLTRLLQPKSVAIIGGGIWCEALLCQLKKIGFSGNIWVVNPNRSHLGDVPTLRDVASLPQAPDAVFLGVNRHKTVEIVAQLAQIGAGGAICFASGFSEAVLELSDGQSLQNALIAAAGDMPILGPNCYGFINALDGVALWPDQHGMVGCDRGVAIITQSSNIAINLTMQQRSLPIAYMVTAGNQAQTSLAQIAQSLLQDDRVSALGLYIEGVGDIAEFETLARMAHRLGKRIVALKAGLSPQAQRATRSHTASIAGRYEGAHALFDRLGIGWAQSLDAMLEALKLCHLYGVLSNQRIAAMSCSGGEASIIADSALAHNVSFPTLTQKQEIALRAALGPKVALANPLDYHTYIWGDVPAMLAAFRAMIDPELGLLGVIVDMPRGDLCDPAAWRCVIDTLIALRQETTLPLALLASLPENMPETVAREVMTHKIAPLCGMDAGLAAIALAVGPSSSGQDALPLLVPREVSHKSVTCLSEAEAKTVLAQFGCDLPRAALAQDYEQIARNAQNLGFPVVLKAQGLAHKTEQGGVVINLRSQEALYAAYEGMNAPSFIVEEMVEDGVVELLLGVIRDPAHGFILLLGAGGVWAELWRETTALLLPTTQAACRAALSELKIGPAFEGYRGAPAINWAALWRAIEDITQYVVAHQDRLIELELNPLILTPTRAIIADALITLGDT